MRARSGGKPAARPRRGGTPRKHYGRAGEYALTPKQVTELLSRVRDLEDEVLLRLAIATGIRREDIVAIPLEGVNLERGAVTFYEAKKRRSWIVPIGGETLQRLEQHMRKLPRGARWLFPRRTNPREHISGRTAYNILQRSLVAAELESRPFHALRSTCVKLAQHRGWSVEQVMRLTGDSFRVIKEHYDVPSDEEMAAAARDHPL